jgi:methylenetetrahydrofolate dehydrogenase (NADP+) / methenyltetrahydrofolate cyclohydrolase
VSAKVLNGKAIAAEIQGELKGKVADLKFHFGVIPRLAVVLVGDNAASRIYVEKKREACAAIGIESELHKPWILSKPYEPNTGLRGCLTDLSKNRAIHGILLQLPLPEGYNPHLWIDAIEPKKDVDVFHPENIGLLVQGRPRFKPCTPHGVQQLLKRSGISVSGKHVVIINRSDVVGKPLSSLLIQDNEEYANATVTVCHNRSNQAAMKQIAATADIIVVAVGQPGFLTPDMVQPGAVVIDVGITRIGKKVVGDCHPEVKEVAGYITPVPGGVGPMTVTMLLENTLLAAKLQNGILTGGSE